MPVGTVYLLAGILMGMVMGGSGDMSLASLHAHVGLSGFTLMVLFALVYRQFPGMARAGAFLALPGGRAAAGNHAVPAADEANPMAPFAPLAELAVAVSVALFRWISWRNGT